MKYWNREKTIISLILLVTVLLSMQWIPTLNAWFGIIDDHGLIHFHHQLEENTLVETLKQTEVGEYGHTKRFRPIYFIFKFIEIELWGKTPSEWYLFRVLIYSYFVLVSLLLIYRQNFSRELKLLIYSFAIFFMTRYYWSGIFTRLGPSEVYAVLGVGLIIHSYLIKRLSVFMLFLGLIISIGSKENFVFLPLYIFILKMRKPISPSMWITLILSSLFAGYVLLGFAPALVSSGSDIYGVQVDLLTRIQKFLGEFKFDLTYLFVFISLVLVRSRKFWQFNLANLLFLIFNLFIYSGFRDAENRYYFPAYLLCFFIFICAFIPIWECLSQDSNFSKPQNKLRKRLTNIIIGITLILSFSGFKDNFQKSVKVAKKTIKFQKTLSIVTDTINADKNIEVLVTFQNMRDYERIYSIERYLKSFTSIERIYLNLSDNYEQKKGDSRLLGDIRKLSDGKGKGLSFYAYSEFDFTKPCIQIFFREKTSPTVGKCIAHVINM